MIAPDAPDASSASADERERLVVEHLGVVRSIAVRFKERGESLDDLQQIGVIGLLKAIDRYDPARAVKLKTYAIPFIVGEIRHYLRDRADLLRIPRTLQERATKTAAAESALSSELGRSPTIAELVERTGLTAEEIVEARELSLTRHVQSLDQPVDPDGHDSAAIGAFIGVEDAMIESLPDRSTLAEAIGTLSGRERIVLGLRYLSDMTQTQVAERLGCSQMQVSRLQTSALRKVRAYLEGRLS
jgi:RNA polymerase sigma-B factor